MRHSMTVPLEMVVNVPRHGKAAPPDCTGLEGLLINTFLPL